MVSTNLLIPATDLVIWIIVCVAGYFVAVVLLAIGTEFWNSLRWHSCGRRLKRCRGCKGPRCLSCEPYAEYGDCSDVTEDRSCR